MALIGDGESDRASPAWAVQTGQVGSLAAEGSSSAAAEGRLETTATPGSDRGSPRAVDRSFLEGGGEMGALVRSTDWSQTPIGPVESWSPTLRMMTRFLLANRFPLLLWWGPEYVQLYNDAYRPIPGTKHPRSLGQTARECWPEIWDVIGPLIDTPFRGGPATWMEDIQLEVNRHGFVEETHFTIAYSPVPDDTAPGGIGGVLATVHEITEKVVGERRVSLLRDLGARSTAAKSAEEACVCAARTIAGHPGDIPFALLYLVDAGGERAHLAAAAGAVAGDPIAPLELHLGEETPLPWPVLEARRTGRPVIVERLSVRVSSVPVGPWSDPPDSAVVLPIASSRVGGLAGFLIAGVSARLELDEAYRGFLELATAQVAGAIATARAYEEERQRAESLAELDRAKTLFFSNVSHEFRTPLTLMLGPIEDLLAPGAHTLSPAVRAMLTLSSRNGLRLLRLVNTLLDFSRIEAGRVRAVYRPTDLGGYTADLASSFRSACERAGLELLVEHEPIDEPVFVDRDMWEKVVLNLVSNAFKFTLRGRIRVALTRTARGVRLQVSDTGTGIPAAEMPRLFERFHRIENAQGRTYEGSGIGLALVQELVRLHHGTVTAESVEGEGSTFTVELPFGSSHLPPELVDDDEITASLSASARPYVEEALRWLPDSELAPELALELPASDEVVGVAPPIAGRDRRPSVLVADDNADMRDYVTRLLAGEYRVRAVADGKDALDAIRAELPDLPDLVLTDVMMPRMDGFGLLRELRADSATRLLPVILLSARAGEESRIDGMAAGADDYLVKPFSARELLARVSGRLQVARLRAEAREAVERRNAQFETLLNEAPLGVYLVDGDFRIRQVNPTALPVFADIPDLVGHDFEEVVRRLWQPGYADELIALFRRTLETGEPYFAPERIEERRDSGLTEAYEWQIHRIPLADGGHGVVCYFRDVSSRVLAQADLRQYAHALENADRRKDEFLATLAHELRNPLAPLRSSLEVLARAHDRPELLAQARAIMERQLGHLVRLVDDLLDVSRISQGKFALRKSRFALASLVEDAVETARPAIEQAGHELSVRLPPEPVYVEADPTRISQVISNLLNNAAKFTERGGHLEVSVERDDDDVVVSVRDDGIGIPAEKLPSVFEMFTQVDPTLERSQGGLGIGLSLVKAIVEMHGGTIEARSEGRGKGSEFRLRLPASAAPAPVAAEPRATGTTALGRRVLVVDDNRDAAVTLATMLKVLGHQAATAHDGLAALEVAQTFAPEIVLLDVAMPGLNGYDTCMRLRELPGGSDLVIVAVTGYGRDDDRLRSASAGFDHHLVKPVAMKALHEILGAEPSRSSSVQA